MRRKLLTCSLVVLVLTLGVFVDSVWAHVGAPGNFSCRASALRVNALGGTVFSEPSVANPAKIPCADDFDQVANVNVPNFARADLVTAKTDADPGNLPGGHAESSAATATVTVGGTTITATVLSARADSGCFIEGGQSLTGSSQVVGLRINNGQVINTSQPVVIPVNALVTIYLNRKIVSGGQITQRALEVDSPVLGTNVVAGEAIADIQSCGS